MVHSACSSSSSSGGGGGRRSSRSRRGCGLAAAVAIVVIATGSASSNRSWEKAEVMVEIRKADMDPQAAATEHLRIASAAERLTVDLSNHTPITPHIIYPELVDFSYYTLLHQINQVFFSQFV